MELIGKFLDFLDRRAVFRRVAFVMVLIMTWRITDWATRFADHWLSTGQNGVEVGAVVAAVTMPFAALQAAVLKFYIDYRETK